MPAKNTVKLYAENSYFHVYNRGVEKRLIFLDKQDCSVFLHYLRMYLTEENEIKEEIVYGTTNLRFLKLNLSLEVDLLAFSLMPNHFHLLVKQHTKDGVTKLLRRVITGYVMYFNKKYRRVGPLFQGIFKACSVNNDEYLLHLSRYIHLNPTKLNTFVDWISFSSYPNYVGNRNVTWIKPSEILSFFGRESNAQNIAYKDFVEDPKHISVELLGSLILEEACIESL